MKARLSFVLIALSIACSDTDSQPAPETYQEVRTIEYGGVSVQVVLDLPAQSEVDVLLAYHGTVFQDSKILEAAWNTLAQVKRITNRRDLLIVSVAYPEENLPMGDNLAHAEAALLWVRNRAEAALGIRIGKVFLVGHSQGGYLVTRLNTLHETDGVVANGPGPLDMAFRCSLEEAGNAPPTPACQLLMAQYGTTVSNSEAYAARSLLRYTDGFKSPILFVQGLQDGSVQMASWPMFRAQVEACSDCKNVVVLEVPDYGHEALFQSPAGQAAFNQFLGF